jgi:hypothetical protein
MSSLQHALADKPHVAGRSAKHLADHPDRAHVWSQSGPQKPNKVGAPALLPCIGAWCGWCPPVFRYCDPMPMLLCRFRLAHRTRVQGALPLTSNAIVFP